MINKLKKTPSRGERLRLLKPKKANGDPVNDGDWAEMMGVDKGWLSRLFRDHGSPGIDSLMPVFDWLENEYGTDIAVYWLTGRSVGEKTGRGNEPSRQEAPAVKRREKLGLMFLGNAMPATNF